MRVVFGSGIVRPGPRVLLPRRFGALLFAAVACLLHAGEPPADSSWRELAPRLYIMDETWSDLDYVKAEITFVNYVRDRTEADVQLDITSRETGDGGREYHLTFLGIGGFSNIRLVLTHTTAPDATRDELREALVTSIRRGLVPYLARTSLRDYLSIGFEPPTAPAPVSDPWRNWVAALSLNGWASGDQVYSFVSYDFSPSVSRVTGQEKLALDGGIYNLVRRFMIDDTTELTVTSRTYYADGSYGRMLSRHLAAGARLAYSSSDYSNIRVGLTAGPRLEYNLVPYSEYVRHKVFVRFLPVVRHNEYFDTTLYNLMRETRVKNELVLGATLTRPWGSLDVSATGSHYLHDFTKRRLSLRGSTSLRVAAGLSVSVSGGYSIIHDQLSLRKGGATEEERLLRLRELATGYLYWASGGVTYNFGSVYANIVNPIF